VAGRRLVHAEVVGRVPRQPDFVLARVRDARGLVPDLPVVHGEIFVGRCSGSARMPASRPG
jgi:hypothetical protein